MTFEKQPMPGPGQENVTERCIAYLQERSRVGTEKYGTPLRTRNGRNPVRDALDEAGDMLQYLMQAYMEQESPQYALDLEQIADIASNAYHDALSDRFTAVAEAVVNAAWPGVFELQHAVGRLVGEVMDLQQERDKLKAIVDAPVLSRRELGELWAKLSNVVLPPDVIRMRERFSEQAAILAEAALPEIIHLRAACLAHERCIAELSLRERQSQEHAGVLKMQAQAFRDALQQKRRHHEEAIDELVHVRAEKAQLVEAVRTQNALLEAMHEQVSEFATKATDRTLRDERARRALYALARKVEAGGPLGDEVELANAVLNDKPF